MKDPHCNEPNVKSIFRFLFFSSYGWLYLQFASMSSQFSSVSSTQKNRSKVERCAFLWNGFFSSPVFFVRFLVFEKRRFWCKVIYIKIDHNSKTKSRTKKQLTNQKISFRALRIYPVFFFLVVETRTWFENANQWYPRTNCLDEFNLKASGPRGRTLGGGAWMKPPTKTGGLGRRSCPNKKKFLNFCTISTISQKTKNSNIAFSFVSAHAHLSRKFGHFWKIFFLVNDTLGNWGVSPKILNKMNHDSKYKNRNIVFSFGSARW